MRIPKYRKHSSGQARVTINGRDYLLGKYGSKESKAEYGRLVAEYAASDRSTSFGVAAEQLTLSEVLAAFLMHAKTYYGKESREFDNLVRVSKPIRELYGHRPAVHFGPAEYKAIRAWWLSDKKRSRQYVNRQMKQSTQIVKWAVSEGMMPPSSFQAIKCVEPLKRGRVEAPEVKPVRPVAKAIVDATLPHLPKVVADMVRFQLATGCRPGEVCKIKPSMVDRSGDVWTIVLAEHKTAYRGIARTIYCGPKAQAVLTPYLLRGADDYCFSPVEANRQRREQRHAERKTPLSCGNKPGSNIVKKPLKKPGKCYITPSYGHAIKYACKKAGVESWAPNQLRHSTATMIRKEYGLDAAAVILGHSEVGVTQVYAEADRGKAIEVARKIG